MSDRGAEVVCRCDRCKNTFTVRSNSWDRRDLCSGCAAALEEIERRYQEEHEHNRKEHGQT